jgi:hypothetical protein
VGAEVGPVYKKYGSSSDGGILKEVTVENVEITEQTHSM